ncbi:MAG: DUF945 family protein [Emcibacter sp.]|nr:DUF945 family protein [Emcibacter sp.]
MKNKKIPALILIIILLLGVTPYLIGKMAKENIEDQVARMSEIPGYSIKIIEYDLGWFTSRMVLSYGLDEHTLSIMAKSTPKSNEPEMFDLIKQGLVFDFTIAHGPITYQKGINLAIMTAQGSLQEIKSTKYLKVKKELGIDEIIDLFVKLSFNGTTDFKARITDFDYDGQDRSGTKLTVVFEGMDLTANINASFDEYNLTIIAPKLSIVSKAGELSLSQINSSANGIRLNDYLWLGHGDFSFAQLNLKDTPKNIAFTVKNYSSKYAISKEDDKFLRFKWNNNIDNFTNHDLNIQDITLDTDFAHLDILAMTDYIKSIRQSYQNDVSQEEAAKNIQMVAIRAGENVLKGSPKLIIHHLDFLMNDGFFKSDATVTFDGDDLINIQQLSDPLMLNKKLSVLANIKFDKIMANALTAIGVKKQMTTGGVDLSKLPKEQLDQMINVQTSAALQTFINQGYLQSEDDIYSSHFHMKDGHKLINGKALAIPGL